MTPPRLLDPSLLVLPVDKKIFVNAAPATALDIDATGRVTRCRIRDTSGSDIGDAKLCKLMMRARFEPSRNADGFAINREYFTVTFKAQS